MGFLNFLAKNFATKIGVVVGGDYKGSSVGYGTKSKQTTVSIKRTGTLDVSNDAIIIFAKPEEIRFGREDIETYSVQNSTMTTTTYSIFFKNGKRSLIEIENQYKHKVDSALF